MSKEIVEDPAPVSCCPKCGSDVGYYTKDYASGPVYYNHNYDGTEADNSEMYNGLVFTRGKYAYCLACYERLFKIKENSQ